MMMGGSEEAGKRECAAAVGLLGIQFGFSF